MMGHQGFASRVKTRKRNILKHREKDLCCECSKKAIKNKTRCKIHLEKQKLGQIKFKEKNMNKEQEIKEELEKEITGEKE